MSHAVAAEIRVRQGFGCDVCAQQAMKVIVVARDTLAAAAQTTCLEFTDGKIMLNDMAACSEVTWERLLASVGQTPLDEELKAASFISAVRRSCTAVPNSTMARPASITKRRRVSWASCARCAKEGGVAMAQILVRLWHQRSGHLDPLPSWRRS